MTLAKEEADALGRCLVLLATLHPVDERRTMALNIERRINGQAAALLGLNPKLFKKQYAARVFAQSH